MSYDFYRLLHIVGVLMVFTAIGSAVVNANVAQANATLKKNIMMLHGIGLLVVLVAGFGAMAKAGLAFQGWVITKIAVWVVIGGSTMLINRFSTSAAKVGYLVLLLGAVAAYMAIFKPF